VVSAAYYREWRKNHPEYRARERERRRQRRARMTPEERRKHRGVHRSTPRQSGSVVVPPLHQGHELFDQARQMAALTNGFKYYKHPFYDDLISEIVLALIEHRDPQEARRRFLRTERTWGFRCLPLEVLHD
jgi:hypothetical protein